MFSKNDEILLIERHTLEVVIDMRRLEHLLLFSLLALLLLFGRDVSESVRTSLQIWWNTLLPGMFVPMILIRFLHARQGFDHLYSNLFNRLFHMEGNAFAYVMCALLLGFPGGSLFLDEAGEQGRLNDTGCQRLIACCCFPTPGFVILSVGSSLYGDSAVGWKLYLCVIASGLVLLMLSRRHVVCASSILHTPPSFFSALTQAIWDSARSMLLIGVYLLLFLVIASLIEQLLPAACTLPLQLLFEFSSAVLLCARLSCALKLRLMLTAALLSFGGLCVHLQIFSALRHCALPYASFLKARILQAFFALCIAALIF